MNRNLYILLLFLVLPFSILKAQYGNIQFIENKGQWDPSIKFVGQVSSGAFYINQRGFTVLQRDTAGWDEITAAMHKHGKKPNGANAKKAITLRSHVYKVEFLNANERPRIVADKQVATYNNYIYGSDPSKWGANCKIYLGITMEDVYPNVDVRFYSNNGYVKYDIIAKPGADISRIALKYDGAEKLEIKNKELIVGTSVGNLKELSPYTYQYGEKGKRELNVKYVLKGNVVSFDVKGYDRSTPMIIDPSLKFCSFTGSTADNWGFTATYGPDGSMFGGGIVFDAGFPVSPGTYQGTYVPGGATWPVDMGIIKLKPDGSGPPTYATYVGGNGTDIPQSLIVDGAGNLIIGGRSNSSNYPTLGTNFFGANGGGGFDIIITKLNALGNGLIGSKRIGGSSDDGDNITPFGGGANSLQRNYGDEARSEVLIDPTNGNILLASCTHSNDFPTVSPIQASSAGAQDGVILRLSADVSTLLFSTYIGGSENDAAYVLAVSPITGDLYVAGGTESTSSGPGQTLFPGNKAGTVGATPGGGIDGFVAQISGTTLTRSTFIGKANYDQIYGIQFDKFGFPYIMGQTKNAWTAINAPFFMNGGKQFIAKLQPDLSAYAYFTLFGPPTSEPNISPVAFLVDRCENVYISGWGGGFGPQTNWDYPTAGTVGLPVTPDAIKGTTDGRDFYFFVLEKNATSQLYGSFFGENNAAQPGLGCDHVDGGTSRFDQNGVIYQAICGNCKSFGFATFPTTPGAWATSNPSTSGGECNLAMVKIEFNLSGVKSSVTSAINGVPRDSAGCAPLTVDFRDTVSGAVTYEWNFGDSPAWGVTTHPDTSHTYLAVGTYIVTLVAVDSSSCNIRDTSRMTIRVGDLPATVGFNPVKLDPCDSFKYRFDNLSASIRPFTDTSFVWDFGDGTPPLVAGAAAVFHNYANPGTYTVKLLLTDTTYCNAPDSMVVQLRVAALVKARFADVPPGCAPYTVDFHNTSDAGITFQWDFGDSNGSNDINPTHTFDNPGTYIVVLTANDPGTCNLVDVFRDTIIVSAVPIASFDFTPEPPLENTPTVFTNNSSPDAIKFVWKFGDGDSLVTTSRANVTHQYNATGSYNACLTVTNAAGCADDTCRIVRALINPLVAVPNAFTPLTGDGNSRIFVRGFGIAKMRFIIWNRWGQKVFETNDQSLGWDGKFKGAVQPMDVYAYTLDVEFFDGTKATKKGDITLIR